MENILNDEIVALCTDLGHFNQLDGTYILNNNSYNTKTCIRDLIKYLRRDDDDFTVRRQMGISNIVQSDLILIIEQHCLNDIELFDRVLRFLVDLTNPTLLHFKEKLPTDKIKQQQFLELQNYLYSYKLSFGANKKVWSVIAYYMNRILNKEERDVEEELMLERILVLIRNILHVPIDDVCEKGTDDDKNAQDKIIEMMHISSINETLLKMCKSSQNSQYCFHLLEIISLMFREQNAEFLAKSLEENDQNFKGRTVYEKDKDRKEFQELIAKETSKRLQTKVNVSRFKGGTFVVKDLKSISERDIICHKMPNNLSKITFDDDKKSVKKPKNKEPMKDNYNSNSNNIHRSTLQIRQYLNEFCGKFLKDSYNQFMHVIRDNLRKNFSLENDETYYLWGVQFFMEYIRSSAKLDDVSLIYETMSIGSFHYLHTLIEHYLEMIKVQKDEWKQWSKRLHYGLKAYKELLFSLAFMHNLRDRKYVRHVEEIKKSIFYELEYRDLLLHLLCDYNETKMSKAFLKDLIETNHVFLKMLENYCKSNVRIVVREKIKKKKKKNPSKKSKKQKITYDPPDVIWGEIFSTISDGLQGNCELPSILESGIKVLDPLSEKSTDEQKLDVMRQINKLLLEKQPLLAISLYREARTFWLGTSDQTFGTHDILQEDEVIFLHDLLYASFPENETLNHDNEEDVNVEDKEEHDEETEQVVEKYEYREQEFSFQDAINKYAHPNVIKALSVLFKQYDINSDQTNHCLVKMLHRIGFDCKMHAMLFQISLFRIFQKILADPLCDSPKFNELSRFAKFIIGRFIEATEKNKKVFIELLFWKNCREAYELEEGYVKEEKKKTTKKSRKKKRDNDSDLEDFDKESQHNFDDNLEDEKLGNSNTNYEEEFERENNIFEDEKDENNDEKHVDEKTFEKLIEKQLFDLDGDDDDDDDDDDKDDKIDNDDGNEEDKNSIENNKDIIDDDTQKSNQEFGSDSEKEHFNKTNKKIADSGSDNDNDDDNGKDVDNLNINEQSNQSQHSDKEIEKIGDKNDNSCEKSVQSDKDDSSPFKAPKKKSRLIIYDSDSD